MSEIISVILKIPVLSLLYFAAIVLYTLLLIFIIKSDSLSTSWQAFAWYLVGVLIWTLTLFIYLFIDVGPYLTLIGRINLACGMPASIGLAAFFYQFPVKIRQIPPLFEKIAIGIAILFFVITVVTPLIDAQEIMSPNGPELVTGPLYGIYAIYMLLNIIAALYMGAEKIPRLHSLNKIKLYYAYLSFIPALSLIVFLNVIPVIWDQVLWWQYSFLYLVPIAIASFYAIHQYRFLQVSDTILKIIRYILLLLAFVATIIIVHFSFLRFLPIDSIVIYSLIESLIALFITYSLSKYLPEFIGEDLRYFKESLNKLSYELYSCRSYADLQKIIEDIFLVQLNLTSAKIYFVSPRRIKSDIPTYTKVRLTNALLQTKDVLVLSELQVQNKTENKMIIEKMQELHAELCLPLRRDGMIIGFLALGAKGDKKLFSSEEIDILHDLENSLVVSFTNILLKSDLQHEVDSLKEIVEQKTARIKKQTTKLRKLSRQQAEFISISAHELRSPLTVALAQSDKLIRTQKNAIPDLQMIHDSLDKLNHLIHTLFDAQLFDLSKVHPVLTTVDSKAYFKGIIHDAEFLLRDRDLTLRSHIDLHADHYVQLDTALMRQVMQNIIANAVKFSPVHTTIRIDISADDAHINICVCDAGEGIPPHELAAIFNKFWDGKNKRCADQGTGLGLYIAHKIIELHNGKIWAENIAKGGARFCIELPKNRSSAKE